jgi:hypothetical protein
MSEQKGNLEIRAVLAALQRFATDKADPAVLFHIACLEVRLAMALDRNDDPEFRRKLAGNVDRLAASLLAPAWSRRAS